MEFKIIKKTNKQGDTRIKTRFLIFPKSINGKIRQLEKASYKQKYIIRFAGFEDGYDAFWDDVEWID